MNADPEVMRYFPGPLSLSESNKMADKISSLLSQRGWGFWALELKENQNFIGFVGLHTPSEKLPFSPCVEIGWRLDKNYWSNGYATEASRRLLQFAFEDSPLQEVVATFDDENFASRNVLTKAGFIDRGRRRSYGADGTYFRITREEWLSSQA